ncbi:hypothetical protein JTE90_006223 [Oedothorax gibbosus]|uniref:glycerophosphocholine cholinephosphodiesterase n=1 Tax=Oedothorax gibbosus TaxID=931172 RepID=A0AAV6VTH9_9ARAC|nr:hypothetical protein JTE90_006223 [Oedothorax gibbosus]
MGKRVISSPSYLVIVWFVWGVVVRGMGYYSDGGGGDGHNKLLLILVDGCRWDYPDQDSLPGFRKLAENGVRAPYVTPIFPANSYPNWYTITTVVSSLRIY